MSTAAQRQLLVEKFLTVIPRQVCILSKDLWRILKSAPKAVKIFGSIWAKNIFSSGILPYAVKEVNILVCSK